MPESPFVVARRRAEAFHVLYWIDHDGGQFVGTVGAPSPQNGMGADNRRYFGQELITTDGLLDLLCEIHGKTFPSGLTPVPAMKFHYTAAALRAAGLPEMPDA